MTALQIFALVVFVVGALAFGAVGVRKLWGSQWVRNLLSRNDDGDSEGGAEPITDLEAMAACEVVQEFLRDRGSPEPAGQVGDFVRDRLMRESQA